MLQTERLEQQPVWEAWALDNTVKLTGQQQEKNSALLVTETILTYESFFQWLMFAPQGSFIFACVQKQGFWLPLIALMWSGAVKCWCQPLM